VAPGVGPEIKPQYQKKKKSYTNGQEVYEKLMNITNKKDMQIKTTMRHHLISVIIKKKRDDKYY
jgi:hypothetical protein